MGADKASVISVNTRHDTRSEISTSSQLSQKKLSQLAAAREKALLARKRKQRDRLEAKLSELRCVLGADMRNSTVEKFAEAIMKQEESLRNKQNQLTAKLIETLTSFRDELSTMKKAIEKLGKKPADPRDTRARSPVTLSDVSRLSKLRG